MMSDVSTFPKICPNHLKKIECALMFCANTRSFLFMSFSRSNNQIVCKHVDSTELPMNTFLKGHYKPVTEKIPVSPEHALVAVTA